MEKVVDVFGIDTGKIIEVNIKYLLVNIEILNETINENR
jgi:hypothetical protein